MKNLLLILASCLLLVSCKEELNTPCFDEILEELDMIKHKGNDDDIDCRWFLEAYKYQNDIYYSAGSHCADYQPIFFNCEENRICEGKDSLACRDFWNNAQRIGIVAVVSE